MFHCLLIATLCAALQDKPILATTILHATAASLDWSLTREGINHGGREIDPLAKPFVHGNASMAAAEIAEVAGCAWMAEKMRHSRHAFLRETWFLWQVVPTGAHVWGASTWITTNEHRGHN